MKYDSRDICYLCGMHYFTSSHIDWPVDEHSLSGLYCFICIKKMIKCEKGVLVVSDREEYLK
jgi:hypothetical protein